MVYLTLHRVTHSKILKYWTLCHRSLNTTQNMKFQELVSLMVKQFCYLKPEVPNILSTSISRKLLLPASEHGFYEWISLREKKFCANFILKVPKYNHITSNSMCEHNTFYVFLVIDAIFESNYLGTFTTNFYRVPPVSTFIIMTLNTITFSVSLKMFQKINQSIVLEKSENVPYPNRLIKRYSLLKALYTFSYKQVHIIAGLRYITLLHYICRCLEINYRSKGETTLR